MSSTLPLEWTPITSGTRTKMKELIVKFESNRQGGIADAIAAAPADAVAVAVAASPAAAAAPHPPPPPPPPAAGEAAAAAAGAAAAAAKDSVDVELLRSMKESGVPDNDIILIAATMLANK